MRNVHGIPSLLVACLVLLLLAVAAAPPARAGGVEIEEQGQGLGNAFAGAQAVGEDASTVWWNPAAMTRIRRHEISVAGTAIWARGDFVDQGSFRAPGLPFRGETGRTDDIVPVPALYAVYAVSPRVKLGLAVNSPFGLITDWGRSWIGRYHGTRSKLTSIDITPTVAWKINRCWSVGGSVSAMYAKAELGNAIDFGALLQQPQAVDGHVDVTGDDWGFGYGLGVLFEPSRRFRVGLNYRSRVTQNLTGDADFQVPGPALPISAVTGRFRDTDVEADIVFPDQLAVGCAWEVAPRWTLLASVAWTNWSLWRDLRVRFANPAEPDAVSRLDWEDTWRVALGATWRPNDRWTLRMGTQWDQSPIQDDTRSPRIPMNDRIWASLGAEYRISRSISVSGSYTHLFIAKGDIDQPSIEAGFLNGYVDGVADLFGLQLNWTF